MSVMLETLASYVPAVVIQRLIHRPDPLRAPLAERQDGALLLADISDFTRLTAEHAAGGPAGAEVLGRTLNAIFAELIDLVHAHGGDVLTFAGDALLAFWPAAANDAGAVGAERAATCALTIQAMLHHRQHAATRSVTLRIGIAAGPVVLSHVGGVGGRWEMLVTGACLSTLSQAKLAAVPGEVVCAAGTWPLLTDRFLGDVRAGGHVRLTATTRALRWQRLVAPVLHPDMQRALHQYLPPSVRERLLAGQTDWLADLRVVTALFVNLPQIGAETPLAETQAVLTGVQGGLPRFRGRHQEQA
ncbi:MAG: adenylate/guanylate cyclase domain-containing protein, partial [Candidatus Sericytochromatia bacterium]|nr:adenylate/guanylate cyclase domain-containing protein [Candidatus Sericytochromatia bacterium]